MLNLLLDVLCLLTCLQTCFATRWVCPSCTSLTLQIQHLQQQLSSSTKWLIIPPWSAYHSLLAMCRVLRARTNTSAAGQLQSRIPDIIHQTYKDSNVPSAVLPMMQSWRKFNPSHEIRFYDDAACNDFVQQHFPEYLHAYR